MSPLIAFVALATPAQTRAHQVPRHFHAKDSPLAIKVRVDGDLVQFGDTSPVMQGSRILVPLRGVFEHVGATLVWDAQAHTVTSSGGSKTIVLPVGKPTATIDGKTTQLDQPAMIIDNATFVPLRFLSEALGAKVDWLAADRVVDIHWQLTKDR